MMTQMMVLKSEPNTTENIDDDDEKYGSDT